jgi:hypothetical protein
MLLKNMNPSTSFLMVSLAIALGAGAAVLPASNPSPNVEHDVWQPAVGSGWQIELRRALSDTSLDVPVYDIDLVENSEVTIAGLQASGRKVICYFSAGTFEEWRPDASSFTASDKGTPLDGWPGEWWLNTKSANVRNIMTARLDLAVSKGCDGVDPDNVDGYKQSTGFGLTTADLVDYVSFLANAAHARGLSIGLKNAGEIVPNVLSLMQWEVNEQCERYKECNTFQPFISAGKPVYRISYPSLAPNVDQATKEKICGDKSATSFSTIMKTTNLNSWVLAC